MEKCDCMRILAKSKIEKEEIHVQKVAHPWKTTLVIIFAKKEDNKDKIHQYLNKKGKRLLMCNYSSSISFVFLLIFLVIVKFMVCIYFVPIIF